jgi:hypothetical protein
MDLGLDTKLVLIWVVRDGAWIPEDDWPVGLSL